MQELQINKIEALELQSFVKKLLSIDKFIFMKVSAEKTVSSVFLPQRDAVKLVSVDTKDLFDVEGTIDKTIKVSFFNGSKVIDALSHFNGEIKGTIVYQDYGDEYIATDFIVYDDNLKINLFCSDPSLSFMEMSDMAVWLYVTQSHREDYQDVLKLTCGIYAKLCKKYSKYIKKEYKRQQKGR